MPSISQPPPLPGFGLPLNHDPQGKDGAPRLFPTALDPDLDDRDCRKRMPVLTIREIAMLQFMNQVTDKKDWENKVFDDAITAKWKEEVLQGSGVDFTKEMADYCIAELKYKAEVYKNTGIVSIYNGDVVKSDTAIPPDLQSALKAAVAPLENVPKQKLDWHPDSDDMVLDLVHPSLYPLVYGLSRILPDDTTNLEDCITRCGQGEIVSVVPEDQATVKSPGGWWRGPQVRAVYSRKFQWLPCDVDISGDNPKIVSYVNNLHPKDHTDLYAIIEKVIEKVIPLWNATLTPLHSFKFRQRIEYADVDYGDLEEYVKKEGPQQREDEDEDDFYERQEEWKDEMKAQFVVQPNPGAFTRPDQKGDGHPEKTFDLRTDYGKTGLQIIVKLANIHLTPEKPKYGGGTWHVEGQMNEHICASAIYYYDNENITTSHLAFRQASSTSDIEEDIPYEQNDHAWLESIFGLENEKAAVQNVGSIEAREGRLVTFPNILQHQVQPFELADPTKPGHRKILALFLVDPNMKIISTANIPCQQREWWGRTITSSGSGLSRLPIELRDKVVQDVGEFPIGLEEAKKLREELMAERKDYVIEYQNKNFKAVTISLCEH